MAVKHEINPPQALTDPGVILRLQMSLGEQDGMLQIEGYVDRDAAQTEYDALADKMRRTALRQRAVQMLPALRRQLENVEYKTNENKKRRAEVLARLAEAGKQRDLKVKELEAQKQQIYDRAYERHTRDGVRGDFKLHGASRGDHERVQKDIDVVEEGRVKERNEADQQLATLDNEIKDGNRLIEQCQVLIAEQEALAGDAASDG